MAGLFEKKVLRTGEIAGTGGNYVPRSIIICICQLLLLEMGSFCSMHGGTEKCIQNFDQKPQ
jgi:hypothetical protein